MGVAPDRYQLHTTQQQLLMWRAGFKTFKQVCDKLGFGEVTYLNWRKKGIPVKKAPMLCQVYNCDLETLLKVGPASKTTIDVHKLANRLEAVNSDIRGLFRHLGMSPNNLAHWLGKRGVPARHYDAICEFLEIEDIREIAA